MACGSRYENDVLLPAQLVGLGELQAFLERGHNAFRKMGDTKEEFLDLIGRRERKLLKQLFAGDDSLLGQ
jgi:hypothetical protein